MTCCATLVCNTALSLIRGYFIASLQTRLSVFLSSSSSSSRPSLFSSPPLSVLPTCQSQLGVIPVAWAVLIDLASPPLREPLQLSRLGDASSIRYLTVNEVLPLQSNTFRVSLTALLASSSSFICPPRPPPVCLQRISGQYSCCSPSYLFTAWNRCGPIAASRQSGGLCSRCILLILCKHMSGSR